MDLIQKVVNKVAGSVEFPAIGKEEDIQKAKEIVGDDSTIFAALRSPPEFYKMTAGDYCKMICVPCMCIPVITANRALEKTLYIVSDKEVKVHVDPFEPPLGIGSPTRDFPKLDFKDVTNVKVVREGGNCLNPQEKTGLEFEDSGIKFFISDPEELQGVIEKAKKLAGGISEGVAKVKTLQEEQPKAADEGQSTSP